MNSERRYKNKGKNVSEKMILEVCTPVHVGSGEELKQGFDFIIRESVPFVVDVEQTLNAIEAHDPRLKNFYNKADIEDLIEIAGEEYGYELPCFSLNKEMLYPVSSSGGTRGDFSKNQQVTYNTIREQIKDAFLKPYIPGSSLKGAIRTALLAAALPDLNNIIDNLAQNLGLQPGQYKQRMVNKLGNQITKQVFGSHPQKDIMRVLHISDGYFCDSSMRLGDVRIVNICNGKVKWKDMAQRTTNQRKWGQAKGLYTEVLTSGSKAEFSVSYDQFLGSDFLSWEGDKKFSSPSRVKDGIKNFKTLREVLNNHALSMIENELMFFKKYSLPEVCKFYSDLKLKIQSDKKAAYLRLSWGSGWTGMTGITDQLLNKNLALKNHVRQFQKNHTTKGLNKDSKTSPVNKHAETKISILYPKTRRLLVYKGSPSLPLGWVKIYPSDGSVSNPYKKASVIKNRALSSSPWLSKQIASLCKAHHMKTKQEVLGSKALAQEWDKLTDGEEKQKTLQEIISYWKKQEWWDNATRKKKATKLLYEKGLKNDNKT